MGRDAVLGAIYNWLSYMQNPELERHRGVTETRQQAEVYVRQLISILAGDHFKNLPGRDEHVTQCQAMLDQINRRVYVVRPDNTTPDQLRK